MTLPRGDKELPKELEADTLFVDVKVKAVEALELAASKDRAPDPEFKVIGVAVRFKLLAKLIPPAVR